LINKQDNNNNNDKKRIALVTGANRGIGFDVCKQLAQLSNDMTVILTAHNFEKGQSATRLLKDKDLDVVFYQLDVSNNNDIKNISLQIEQQYGRLDVLVNNAAILYNSWQEAIDADLQVVNRALETNLFGPWRLCQVFIPLMKKNRYGRIVNVSSGAGSLYYMQGGTPAYGISKVAVNALTRKLAFKLRGTSILVNSVDPGWVATDMGGHGGRPVKEGAKGIVWAATLSDDGPTEGFFYDGKPEEW
jgi:NAD(P)-dependent dehydrogenase (short-subunit alcohol dehydrogenase family)